MLAGYRWSGNKAELHGNRAIEGLFKAVRVRGFNKFHDLLIKGITVPDYRQI
jgi:hypothetical protein